MPSYKLNMTPPVADLPGKREENPAVVNDNNVVEGFKENVVIPVDESTQRVKEEVKKEKKQKGKK